ncbi:MAG: Maf family nucleotide pyrophosphatase [Candidatus Omnitrophica bacterium]|nr:Maf family nucleotide pyrophosphatase [Candidatus Omnitrophota bacterium]
MRKIYLASDSKARKKLLSFAGLRFKVVASRVKERKEKGRLSYAELVKNNALLKAKNVAKDTKHGIIIGADTIVTDGRNIFGKPRDLAAARLMLKKLSARPQWIYTGIAVIDQDKNKVFVSCEKTKIYMDRLSDKEINNYFAKVSPLDKAGSFDIQGSGAFFIRRIEGCFYNVVGLPLRKLYRMLKGLGVDIFVFLFCVLTVFSLAGCSTEYNLATRQEESYYYNYSTDKEVQMGRSIAIQVEKEYKLTDDPLLQKRVEDIGKKIVAVCDRKEIDYYFLVIDDEEINAFSLPGGFIFVNRGLVEKVANDDELAGVIAHEVGHIVARHSIKKLQALQGYSLLNLLVAAGAASGSSSAGELGAAAEAAFVELLLGYSREDELLADQLGTRYEKSAGYNPRGMITFLQKLQEVNRRKPLQPRSYYKTHPYIPDRIRVVKQELGDKADFDDYINTEQAPHPRQQ